MEKKTISCISFCYNTLREIGKLKKKTKTKTRKKKLFCGLKVKLSHRWISLWRGEVRRATNTVQFYIVSCRYVIMLQLKENNNNNSNIKKSARAYTSIAVVV